VKLRLRAAIARAKKQRSIGQQKIGPLSEEKWPALHSKRVLSPNIRGAGHRIVELLK
jgi:hypothetical protein